MDHEKTLKLLAKALEIAPGDWETRSHMAGLCLELGRMDQAAELVEAAPQLPDDMPGKLHAAELLSRAGAANAALRIADDLITENKANARAHLLKAHIYRERGMQIDARKHYNVAAVIDESLEDLEFEAWLDGRELPSPSLNETPFANSAPHPNTDGPDETLRSPFDLLDEPSDYDQAELNAAAEKVAEFLADEINEEFEENDPFDDDGSEFNGEFEDPLYELADQPTIEPIQFKDVGGMEEIKERVRMKIIYPFKNQGVFEKFKKKAGGGMLLYGPPGCGKTLIARATAGECGSYFNSISISDILSKWLGESERRLSDIFRSARACRPSIIFIDELDALGVRRSDTNGAMSSLVNVLLTEIDDATNKNDGLLVLAATNTPWRIDSAFRRPGRFDQTLFVPPPDEQARASTLEILLRDIPKADINLQKIITKTEHFSGADLRALVDSATEAAISEEMRSGKDTVLSEKMLLTALKQIRPSTTEWFDQAANYASYANQSGLYNELAEYLKQG